jgi:hypothetical protein
MMSALRLIDMTSISGVGCVGVLLSSSICAPTLALFSSFDRSHLTIFTLLCWPWLWSDVGPRAAVVCLAAHLDALRFKDPR